MTVSISAIFILDDRHGLWSITGPLTMGIQAIHIVWE